MSTWRMTVTAVAWVSLALLACGQPGQGGGSAETQAVSGAPDGDVEEAAPQRRIEQGQLRVTLVVLPGDAEVEVDGVPVRRRDGVIELVGKANEKRRLRVFKEGVDSREYDVTLETDGPSPPLIDLFKTPPVKEGQAGGSTKALEEAPVDPLLPEDFE